MTQTLTTDELRQIVETDHTQCGDAAAMARELLANREAQPVAFLSKGDVDTSQPHILAKKYRSLACTLPVFTAPLAPAVPDVGDWRIDESTGVQILMYKDCSVIEDQQARYVLSLIHGGVPAVPIPDKVSCEGFNPKDWVEARNLGQCEGWNAYRAELLAQPLIQSASTAPPVLAECEPDSIDRFVAQVCGDLPTNNKHSV